MMISVDLLRKAGLHTAANEFEALGDEPDKTELFEFYHRQFSRTVAILYDYKEQLQFDNPAVVAKAVSNIVNIMGDDRMRKTAELMAREHRTLQQAIMRLFVMFCEELTKNGYDLRNEAAYNLAKKVLANDPHLPTV